MLQLSEQGIDWAIQRLKDFASVQNNKSMDEKLEALNNLTGGLGFDGDKFDYMLNSLSRYFPEDAGYVATGIIIGLRLAEYELDV